jgi:hypothetical protein
MLAKDLQEGQILVSKNARNRKIRAVYHSTFRDKVGGVNKEIQQTYVVVPSSRGRGLSWEVFNSTDRVSIKR